jgi:hypothetical protein
MMAKLSIQEIGNNAIEYVMEHLRSEGETPIKQASGHGPDIMRAHQSRIRRRSERGRV